MTTIKRKRKQKAQAAKPMPTSEPLSPHDTDFRPGAPRPPKTGLRGSMIWIYGEPKIGKTTFASRFPGAWFFATEKGQDWIEIREPTPISCWDEFLEVCAWIAANKPETFLDGTPIETLVFDTVSELFVMCQEQVCVDLGVENPADLDHGKGWARLTEEFQRVMGKIRRWPYTTVCISPSRTKEFKTKVRKIDRYEPAIGAAGWRWCMSAADLVLLAYSEQHASRNEEGEITGAIREGRSLLCQPQSWAVAGGRMSHRLPKSVELGYDTLIEALTEEE